MKRFALFFLAMTLSITLGGTVLLWKKIVALPPYFIALVTGAVLLGLIPGLLTTWAERYGKNAASRANSASFAGFLSVGISTLLPTIFSPDQTVGYDAAISIGFGAIAALLANGVSRWISWRENKNGSAM